MREKVLKNVNRLSIIYALVNVYDLVMIAIALIFAKTNGQGHYPSLSGISYQPSQSYILWYTIIVSTVIIVYTLLKLYFSYKAYKISLQQSQTRKTKNFLEVVFFIEVLMAILLIPGMSFSSFPFYDVIKSCIDLLLVGLLVLNITKLENRNLK